MDLNELVHYRLVSDERLTSLLCKYAGAPAIFCGEFPNDQQAGWDNKVQYPRISYRINMQVDAARGSSGLLHIGIYCEKNPIVLGEIEDLVKECLKDVLMQPTGEAPLCVAWKRSDPFELEGTAILITDMVFDIIEYPDQITTDPDPVEALNIYLKKLLPDAFVLGIDEVQDTRIATNESPVIYVRMVSYENDHISMALTWINCVMEIHLIAPSPDRRIKHTRTVATALNLDGEIALTDGAPLRFTGIQARNARDYLVAGQITVSAQYILSRIKEDAPMIDNIVVKGR